MIKALAYKPLEPHCCNGCDRVIVEGAMIIDLYYDGKLVLCNECMEELINKFDLIRRREMSLYDQFLRFVEKQNIKLLLNQKEMAKQIFDNPDLWYRFRGLGTGKTFIFELIEDFLKSQIKNP